MAFKCCRFWHFLKKSWLWRDVLQITRRIFLAFAKDLVLNNEWGFPRMIKNYFFQVKSVYNFVNKGRQSRCNECFFNCVSIFYVEEIVCYFEHFQWFSYSCHNYICIGQTIFGVTSIFHLASRPPVTLFSALCPTLRHVFFGLN